MLSLLAVIAVTATSTPMPSFAPTAPLAPQADAVTVVYLGCEVRQTLLSDCKVVNHEPVEPGAVAEALKLASGMMVPQDLADRLGGHIVVKLNVKQ